LKKILSLKTVKIKIGRIFVLKDGRIILYNEKRWFESNFTFIGFVFDLKDNNNFIFLNNVHYIHDLIQIEDGKIIVSNLL
jgi:hypothetical protein